jgi:hypothetical protein
VVLKLVRFVSLFLTALVTGLLFCHLLELPNKMKMPADVWLPVQQHLYNAFGPVASIIEPLAIVSTLLVLVLVRRRAAAAILTLLAALCLIAHLAEWFAVVNPANLQINSWTKASIPADWTATRMRWEYGHAAGAALTLVALAALIAALLNDNTREAHAEKPAGQVFRKREG